MLALLIAAPLVLTAPGDLSPSASLDAELSAELNAERQRLRPWHIAFGNIAWASTTITTILGVLQFRDRFGRFDSESNTPCARGNAIIPSACEDVPLPHAISATIALSMYTAVFSIGAVMPDPAGLAESPGTYGRRLRRHKALRWVLLGMMVMQTALGAISANLNDFETRRAIAGVHLGLGLATWSTMFATGIYGSLLAY
ncbi:MAG: hypothetical protein AAGE52_12440 [Myxococcota bacterium]